MSKGRGKKIAIKFDKALLGDVTGNESAFAVTGFEKDPLFYGEPTLREYAVEKVERYPIAELWRDDFSGQMDGVEVGVNGLVLENDIEDGESDSWITEITSSGTFSWYENRFDALRDFNLFKITHRVRVAGLCTVEVRTDVGTVLATATATAAAVGDWLTFTLDQLLPLNNGTRYRIRFTVPSANTVYRTSGQSGTLWQGIEWVGGGTTYAGNANMGLVEGLEVFDELGTHTPPPIDATTLPTNPRIIYETDLPTGTSVTVEYALNQDDETPPETWTAIDTDDLLTIPNPATGYFLWLRYTLATADTSVTPTLLAVWLEEAEAPPDTILLTMTEAGLFRDVEGHLTVAYDQALGNLKGTRPVASFEVSFTPAGLEPTPVHEHTITARGEPVVSFIPVTYHDYPDYTQHTITARGTGVFVDFIHIDDIVT